MPKDYEEGGTFGDIFDDLGPGRLSERLEHCHIGTMETSVL